MLIRTLRGWEISQSQATPEAVMLGRRKALAGAASLGAATLGLASPAQAQFGSFFSSLDKALVFVVDGAGELDQQILPARGPHRRDE